MPKSRDLYVCSDGATGAPEVLEGTGIVRKTLAIVGFCYGSRYQQFLPFYAYSALRAYPEHTVLLYVDRPLASEVETSLTRLKQYGDVRVTAPYDFGLKGRTPASSAAFRSLRWLFFDPEFEQFDAVYSGDIDIFFAREQDGILAPHAAHAKMLGLPYSNYLRLTADEPARPLRQTLAAARDGRWRSALGYSRRLPVVRNRLSGLHFVMTAEYFPRVVDRFDSFVDQLSDGRSMLASMTDEEVLYQLMRSAGVGLPPVSPNSPEMDGRNFGSVAYRPHHGIHLGVFRDESTILRSRQVLQSYVYRDYFDQYRACNSSDVLFRNLRKDAGPYVRRLFSRMDRYLAEHDDNA